MGGHKRWTAQYSIATIDALGREHQQVVTGVPGVFQTRDEAMGAACEAGRRRAEKLSEPNFVKPNRDENH